MHKCLFGNNIMSKLVINIGSGPNSHDGDTNRLAFDKINQNFTELYDVVSLLGGNVGPGGTTEVNIKGNVLDINGNILLDATTGKLTLSAVPNFIPVMYSFRANFDNAGNLTTIQNLPAGWTYQKSSNLVTITYSGSLYPKIVSYWGAVASGELRLRYPTAGYQVTRPSSGLTRFTLNLNSAVTGADNNQYALITVLF